MKKNKVFFTLIFFLSFTLCLVSCSNQDNEYVPVSPVLVDLTQVPYAKLSDYKFFEGELKLQNPSLNVIPFEPASSLFTDYAHKKRFVWMPSNVKASYDGDDNVLNFPIASLLQPSQVFLGFLRVGCLRQGFL